jgi:hypothetical protein
LLPEGLVGPVDTTVRLGRETYPYTRHDLPLGSVSYTAGRFDNNAWTDLVITTASGSYWYFSNGDGSWTYPYTRHDLPLQRWTSRPRPLRLEVAPLVGRDRGSALLPRLRLSVARDGKLAATAAG